MTHIPPEGDEYNARRQEELHAAVENKATMTRRFHEMVRDNAPTEQISQVVEVIAQLDREIPHISKDLAVSVQGRNLSIFMDRMGVELAANTKAIERAVEAATLRALTDVVVSLDQITALVQQGIATGQKALAVAERSIAIGEKAQQTGLEALSVGREALAIAKAGDARMPTIEHQYEAIAHRLMQGEQERAAIDEKLDLYIAGSKRSDVEALQIEIREMRGPDMPPEQRARYITILMRIIAEWEAAHPDEATV